MAENAKKEMKSSLEEKPSYLSWFEGERGGANETGRLKVQERGNSC